MQQISTAPKPDAWRLPCPAHAPGQVANHVANGNAVSPPRPAGPPSPTARPEREAEPCKADRALHALAARFTGGISPIALSLAYIDWAWHLAAAPQRQLQISDDAWRSAGHLFEKAAQGFGPDQGPWSLIKPKPQDRRFADPQWERPPFNMLAQAFLLSEQWWHNATTGVRGVAPANEAVVEFSVRQLRDMLSPSNFAATIADGVPERRRDFRARLAELGQGLAEVALPRRAFP